MSTFALNTKGERSSLDKYLGKVLSWERGQNPWITIENTGGDIGKKPFVRVKANQLWGDPRRSWIDKKEKSKDE